MFPRGRAAGAAANLWLLAALAAPGATWAQPTGAEGRAARLLDASEAERRQLLEEAGFASVEVARALLAASQQAMLDAAFPRAVRGFRVAEAVARRAGAEAEAGRALNGAAFALLRQGEMEPALQAAEAGLALHLRIGDVAGQAEAWNTIGSARRAKSAGEATLEAYRKALALWTSIGDRHGMARATGNIASLENARGNYDAALSRQREALRLFEEVGDLRAAAIVMDNMAITHVIRGEHAEALEHTRRALALSEQAGDRWGISHRMGSLAYAHFRLGDYARALDLFQRVLKLSEEFGDRERMLGAWNGIGEIHFFMGDYERAIEAYKRALRLNATVGSTVAAATGHNAIGDVAWALGQLARAEANYRVGLRLAERHGYKNLVAEALRGLGRVAAANGRPREARTVLQRALSLREAMKDQDGMVEALNSLARLELDHRRAAQALDHARRATEIAQRYEQPHLLWEAHTLAGIAQRRLQQPAEARASLDRAIQVVEELRVRTVGQEQGRQRFFEGKLSPYHELMALALARGSAHEALELAERSKARVLADLMRRGRPDVRGTMSQEDREEETRLRAAVVSLNLTIQAERQKERPDAGRLAALDAERQGKRKAHETFQSVLEARHPELALQRGGVPAFTFPEAGRLLPNDSVAILEYAVAADDSYLFVLTRDSGVPRLDWFALGAGRESLAPRARRLRERLAGRALSFADDARPLYDLLLAPALPRLKGREHVVIVPDGPLWDIPFQALLDPGGRHLIESLAVSYAPSLTVLREVSTRAPAGRAPASVLAMGKADFGAQGAPPVLSLMSDLGPLPDAERQVRMIGALYGPDRSTTYIGPEAREDRFKAEAPRHRILHLATHGVLDESAPLYSHVVLSPGSRGSPEDGLLEAWEIMDMKLSADLVVLSACETGRGRIAPGEGIVGTMWAAFVAGAQALLASQWKVESASTTELMIAFHRRLAGAPGDKAAHLRRASLDVLRQPSYAHPFYWAGFVLVGNPY